MIHPPLAIGTAGWSIPKQHAPAFPPDGTHLERYAGRLPVVEINTSFYRPHKPATYERWAAGVPPLFRFAVKIPRTIVSAATRPLSRRRDGQALSASAQHQGMRSSMRLLGHPLTRRFSTSVK